MNSDAKFWACIWSIAGTLVVGIAITSATYDHNKNVLISEMVKNGMSPIAASCALDDTIGSNPTCVILATKEKE